MSTIQLWECIVCKPWDTTLELAEMKLARVLFLVLLGVACTRERSVSGAQQHPANTAQKVATASERVTSPAGINAAEPFLFTTRDGGAGLSWLEPVGDTDRVALRFAVHRNGQWSAPRTV